MLHEQKETDSPFEITKDSNDFQKPSSDSSDIDNKNMTKMLQSHLLASNNDLIRNMQAQKTKIYNEKELDTI